MNEKHERKALRKVHWPRYLETDPHEGFVLYEDGSLSAFSWELNYPEVLFKNQDMIDRNGLPDKDRVKKGIELEIHIMEQRIKQMKEFVNNLDKDLFVLKLQND